MDWGSLWSQNHLFMPPVANILDFKEKQIAQCDIEKRNIQIS